MKQINQVESKSDFIQEDKNFQKRRFRKFLSAWVIPKNYNIISKTE
jgi:hypothetical protein